MRRRGGQMNINQLEYLVESVSRGSFASAARSLFVSSQAVSRGVADLERELGISLFEKSGNKAHPTSFCISFSERAREVLRSLDDLKAMADLHGTIPGDRQKIILAVGSSALNGRYLQTKRLKGLLDRYPQIDLSIMFNESSTCLSAVEMGMADAAIVFGRAGSSGMHSVKLFEFPVYIALSLTHRLAKKRSLSVGDLEGAKLAAPCDLRYRYPAFKDYLKRSGVRLDMCNIEADVSSYRSFMEDEHGMVLTSRNFLEMQEFYPRCVCIPLEQDSPFVIPVCFVCREKARNAAIRCLEYHLMTSELCCC